LRARSGAPRARSELAGVRRLRRVEDLQRLVRRGNGGPEREEVPLVLRLSLGLHRERVGLLDELVVPGAEVALARLENVELRLALEIRDQLLGVRRLGRVHRLREDLERYVLDPGVVLGRLAVALAELGDEGLRARRVDFV